jgi:hypothetical protein
MTIITVRHRFEFCVVLPISLAEASQDPAIVRTPSPPSASQLLYFRRTNKSSLPVGHGIVQAGSKLVEDGNLRSSESSSSELGSSNTALMQKVHAHRSPLNTITLVALFDEFYGATGIGLSQYLPRAVRATGASVDVLVGVDCSFVQEIFDLDRDSAKALQSFCSGWTACQRRIGRLLETGTN